MGVDSTRDACGGRVYIRIVKPRKAHAAERVKKVVSFLRDSFSDYIAARVLFRAELPQQAAILSSTAIEKCVKAMLALQGNESHGHLKAAHRNFVRNFNPDLYQLLDDDFLILNQKLYSLRYTDDLPMDFNVVIATREFLAEMDWTIATMFSCFSLQQGHRTIETPYTQAVQSNDVRLTFDNHVLSKIPKALFIYSQPQFVYELRNHSTRGLLEVTYLAKGPPKPKRAGFLRAGWVSRDKQGVEYSFAFGSSDDP